MNSVARPGERSELDPVFVRANATFLPIRDQNLASTNGPIQYTYVLNFVEKKSGFENGRGPPP